MTPPNADSGGRYRRRPDRHSRITTAVRFPNDVHEALRETADDQGCSINWLVNRAVTEFLEHLELPIRFTPPRNGSLGTP
jgi:hypothetical protein